MPAHDKPVTVFDDEWAKLAERILYFGELATNDRTGKRVRQVPGAGFRMQGLPLLTLRDINVKWPAVEVVWFISGSGDVEFMRSFGFKAWDAFTMDIDRRHVPSATGYRWRRYWGDTHDGTGVDQLMAVVDELRLDPTSRQAVLCSWDPDSELARPRAKNVPCVPFWHFCIIDGRLHLSVLQRSADVWFGLPHDIAGGALLLALMARHLGVEPGFTSWLVGNAHLYEDQWEPAKELLDRRRERGAGWVPNPSISLETDLFERAMNGDDTAQRAAAIELTQKLEAWYKPRAGAPVRGPRLAK